MPLSCEVAARFPKMPSCICCGPDEERILILFPEELVSNELERMWKEAPMIVGIIPAFAWTELRQMIKYFCQDNWSPCRDLNPK